MKRWIAAGLTLAVLAACSRLPSVETASSPIDAALKAAAAADDGQESVCLRVENRDEDALFRAIEAVWPYACTIKLTEYPGGFFEVALEIKDRARQEQAATLARGLAQDACAGLEQDADKLRALHDLLIRSCAYDLDTARQQEDLDGSSAPFTAYGALVDGKAVCAGYARAYLLLCRAAGLDAIYVASPEMNHGWNAVRLNGQTYFIDCTFDDPVPDRDGAVSYEYFLRTAEELSRTHTWDQAFYEQVMDAKWGA